jgi:hypothetical protein
VKLRKAANNQLEFELDEGEKDVLLRVLRLYPMIRSGYQPLSRTGEHDQANQRLLDEALQESRQRNQSHLETFLADPAHFKPVRDQWHLVVSSTELDWLLEVLNDVRIGSWISLGSPQVPLSAFDGQNARHFWAMEIAGLFQMRFLELIDNSD